METLKAPIHVPQYMLVFDHLIWQNAYSTRYSGCLNPVNGTLGPVTKRLYRSAA